MVLTARRPLDEDLILDLRMSEGSGSKVFDVSEERNHGTIVGAAWVDGKYGKGLHFNGTTDEINCGSDVSLEPTNEITIIAWVKLDDVEDSIETIAIKYSNYTGYLLRKRTDTTIQGYIGNGFGDSYGFSRDISWEAAVWYQVAYVVSVSGGYQRLYLNGEQLSTEYTTLPSQIGDSGTDLKLFDSWDGVGDEVRIYDRALSSEEIALHYTSRGRM